MFKNQRVDLPTNSRPAPEGEHFFFFSDLLFDFLTDSEPVNHDALNAKLDDLKKSIRGGVKFLKIAKIEYSYNRSFEKKDRLG